MIKQCLIVVALLCATTLSVFAQNIYPHWYNEGKNHFNVEEEYTESNFAMFVMGTIDEVRLDSAFEIGVFCEDECRAAQPFFTTSRTYDIFQFYSSLVVNGVSGEAYRFRLYDHRNGVEVLAEQTPDLVNFVADGQYGSFNTGLYELAFRSSTTHRASLRLDDETPLPFSGSQYAITPEGIACSYTRNAFLDGGYETLVLPFDADVTALKELGFAFEKFCDFSNHTIRFVELDEDEVLQAGVAYLFRYTGEPSDEQMEITFTGSQQRVTDNLARTEGWAGTFTDMDGAALAGKYILNIKGDTMNKAGEGASLNPYHAYLELPSAINVAKLSVVHVGQSTGISDAIAHGHTEGNGPTYDLSGRIVTGAPRCGIVIKNNKKILIK